jgi:hypothetical protein
MGILKLTVWNVEWLDTLLATLAGPASAARRAQAEGRIAALCREIAEIDPDILCIIEGPRGEAAIVDFAANRLGGAWLPVLRAGDSYEQQGRQWIWFLVKPALAPRASMLPIAVWRAYTAAEAPADEGGASWPVHFWGKVESVRHAHYRHPQVLVLDWNGLRVEFIGLHLKSKLVTEGRFGSADPAEHRRFVEEALKARVKLATEAVDVRYYVEHRFRQEAEPAIFLLGDLNDGPGKELFERRYLFFDLVSNIQGDVFFARRFFNHALFDYLDELRWTVFFRDVLDPGRDPRILLDHILFSQGLVGGNLPWRVRAGAGNVEHEIHDRINATQPARQKTADHKPVSCLITVAD